MKRYRKKPIVVEAMQIPPINEPREALYEWTSTNATENLIYPSILDVKTKNGLHQAMPGDYIIKGVQNEFYPCPQSVFEETYEEVVEELANV